MSRVGWNGSRRPPRLRLITRAPWSAAQRIAAPRPRCGSCRPAARPSRSGAARGNAMPGDADLVVGRRRRSSPATNVPWPSVSTLPARRRRSCLPPRSGPAKSGWPSSRRPSRRRATLTGRQADRRAPARSRTRGPAGGTTASAIERVVREVRLRGGVRCGSGQRERQREARDEALHAPTTSATGVVPGDEPVPGREAGAVRARLELQRRLERAGAVDASPSRPSSTSSRRARWICTVAPGSAASRSPARWLGSVTARKRTSGATGTRGRRRRASTRRSR